MVRKSNQHDSKGGNTTVAAVQSAHAHSAAQNVKANMTSQQQKNTGSQKQATPMASAIQQHAAKSQQKAAIMMNQKPQQMAAQKTTEQRASTPQKSAASKQSYEIYMNPTMFQEPASWTLNQAPCHAPHIMARPMKKQNSSKAVNAQSEPTAVNHKKPTAKNNSKSKMHQKSAVNFNSAAGKQLVLRPTGALILYRPLWMQVRHWAIRMAQEHERRGRSARMSTKAQKIQQQKERIMEQRKHADMHKSHHGMPPKQQSNSQIQQSKNEMKNAPVNWQENIWEDFFSSKHASLNMAMEVKDQQKMAPAPFQPSKSFKKNRQAPGRSLKSSVPPPIEAKDSEIFSFLPDGPGIYSPAPQQQIPPPKSTMRRQAPGISNSSPTGDTPDVWADYVEHTPKPMMASQPQHQQAAHGGFTAWFSPQTIAIASAFVAMGGVGISKIFAA